MINTAPTNPAGRWRAHMCVGVLEQLDILLYNASKEPKFARSEEVPACFEYRDSANTT